MPTLADSIQVLFPTAIAHTDWIVKQDATGAAYIAFWNAALGAQPTQAQTDAVTQAQVDALATNAARTGAISIFLNDHTNAAVVLRGVALALVDQINVLRAALPTPLSAITVAQAKTAIQNKINSAAAD